VREGVELCCDNEGCELALLLGGELSACTVVVHGAATNAGSGGRCSRWRAIVAAAAAVSSLERASACRDFGWLRSGCSRSSSGQSDVTWPRGQQLRHRSTFT
jgi:hypothetical protein